MPLFNHLYISLPVAVAIIFLVLWYTRKVKARLQGLESVYLSHLSQIYAQSKRRYTLIPAMTEKVREYAPEENSLLKEIERESSRAGVAVEHLKRDFRNPGAFSELRNRENTVMHRLTVLNEHLVRYPALRNTASFCEISGELKTLEDKIAFNIRLYNDSAAEFNSYCHGNPLRKIISHLLGFRLHAPVIEGMTRPAPENTAETEEAPAPQKTPPAGN